MTDPGMYTAQQLAWDLARLRKVDHVRGCFRCKTLLDRLSWTQNMNNLLRGKILVLKHVEASIRLSDHRCEHSTCIFHEEIASDLARSMLWVAKSERPMSLGAGVEAVRMLLGAPGGADGNPLAQSLRVRPKAELQIVIRPVKAKAHLLLYLRATTAGEFWASFARILNIEELRLAYGASSDPQTVWEAMGGLESELTKLRSEHMEKYALLKMAAEMDSQFCK